MEKRFKKELEILKKLKVSCEEIQEQADRVLDSLVDWEAELTPKEQDSMAMGIGVCHEAYLAALHYLDEAIELTDYISIVLEEK